MDTRNQNAPKNDAQVCQKTSYACKVSVVIPVYNMARYLEYGIGCWTNQTLRDIEIICVNDGSTDDSLNKLQELAGRDDRIRVFSFPENKSPFAARKLGIKEARGEYIMIADADDYVLPETCEELYQQITTAQVDILHFKAGVAGTDGASEEKIADVDRCLSPYEGMLSGSDVFTACFRDGKYHYYLWDKIYKAQVCKDAIAHERDVPLYRGDDKVLYAVIAYTAQSYKGVAGKRYYQYNLGMGNESDGTWQYTAKHFEKFCKNAHCAAYMEDFIQRQGTERLYNDVLQKNYRDLQGDCIRQWFLVKDEEKAQAFDLLIHYWRPHEVVSRLAELKFYDTAGMAKLLQGAVSLKYDGHPVKTIAAYYHRIANGGTERALCQLCGIWQEMGCKVIVLTDKAPCAEDYELPSGTERIVLPDYAAITPETYHERASILQHLIQEYQIDAVVSYAWEDHLLFWDELAVKTAGAAFIVHCQNVFSSSMLWDNKYDNRVFPLTIADAVVSLSDTDYAFWKYFNANTHITYNPLTGDITTWHPEPFAATHKILWIGRLEHIQKNPVDILPIMQDVIKAVPDAVLTIVGKSEDGSVEKQLQEHITKLHLEDHIKLEGFHTDVRPWYLSSQIFLMTSSFEGHPLTLQESKMAGIPCVMYELPYLTLCKGNRGLIPVPQRDTKAAAQAIIRLLQDDALCAQYGHDARAHIEELAQSGLHKKWRQIFESVEHTHAPVVSKAERLMMETLIAYHGKSLQNEKDAHDKDMQWLKKELDSRNQEIHQLRHGSYIRRVVRAVVPNRAKPFLKAIVHRIPKGIKNPVKRLLRWG